MPFRHICAASIAVVDEVDFADNPNIKAGLRKYWAQAIAEIKRTDGDGCDIFPATIGRLAWEIEIIIPMALVTNFVFDLCTNSGL